MAKAKSLFGLWSDMKVPDINRLLKPHGVRLVLKKSKEWGEQVSVTCHKIDEPVVPASPLATVPTGPSEHSLASVQCDHDWKDNGAWRQCSRCQVIENPLSRAPL